MPNHKKRKLTRIKINELSSVDKPAQEGAVSVIMKRADNPVLLTLADDSGHSHLIEFNRDYDRNETSYSRDEGDESPHQHPFVIKDGVIIIGETNGHTHEVDTDDLNQTLMTIAMVAAIKEDLEREENLVFKSLPNTSNVIAKLATITRTTINPASGGGPQSEEGSMAKKENEEVTLASLQKSLDETNEILTTASAELEIAKVFGELSDVEKVHYSSLDDAGKAEFLKKAPDARKADLELLKAADPIVYTSLEGEVFYKSDDARYVAMAKRADETQSKLAEQMEKAATTVFEKRAETELKFMPGKLEEHVALLKAVDTITDETMRTNVNALLKAKNATMGSAFEVVGEGGEGESITTKAEANVKLNELAKAYATEHKMTFEDAYDIIGTNNLQLLQKAL